MNLPNEIPIPIEADHRDMCRFTNKDSEKYRMVYDCLKELVDDALEMEQPCTSLSTSVSSKSGMGLTSQSKTTLQRDRNSFLASRDLSLRKYFANFQGQALELALGLLQTINSKTGAIFPKTEYCGFREFPEWERQQQCDI
jgi:hypothetical protein